MGFCMYYVCLFFLSFFSVLLQAVYRRPLRVRATHEKEKD